MKLQLLLELHDSPGQLQAALSTISRYGGNIVSVLHEHGKRRGDWVPVRIILEAPREAHEPIVAGLRETSRVLSVEGAAKTLSFAFLLLGHVFESQVKDVTDAVFACGGEVRRLTAEIASRDQPSAALVEVAAPDRATLLEVRARVGELARGKGLSYVEAIGGADP